jgi:hypothetical protein
MSPIGIDETNLFPSDFHNNLVSLKYAKGNSSQETCENFLDFFAILRGYETFDVHRLFQ